MKTKCSFLLIAMFLTSLSNAQSSNGKISGKVIDTHKTEIAYATVSILTESGNLVTGSITEDSGRFNIGELSGGKYILEISFLGYEKFKQEFEINSTNSNIKLKEIILIEDKNTLDEIVVSAEKSQYNLKMDKKIFNVGKDVLAQGGNALDILDQVAQVSVQPSGSVELRGSSAVQILINGRRSGLTMNNAIDQLDIENIDRIEVITNPSAQFDANGSAGIINIVLKKNKGMGLKGSIRSTVGTPANHILMPGISYKSSKFNIFGNLRWRYSDYNGIYTVNQKNKNENNFEINSHEIEDRHDDGLSFFGGADYSISDNTNFTVAYFRANTKDTDFTTLDYNFIENLKNIDVTRIGNSLEKRNYNQLESSFQHNFSNEQKVLKVNMQYDFWNSNKNWDLTTTSISLPQDIEPFLRTLNISGSRDLVVSSDLEWPLLGGKFMSGIKGEKRKVNNSFLAENKREDQWTTYKAIDNDVEYKEIISGAYVDFSKTLNKLQFKIGLRGEHSNISIANMESTNKNVKKYFNLFPSGFISYPINDAFQFQAGYSRRINRPSLWNLYPFNDITNINIIDMGNPYLDPSYTNGFETSIAFRSEKISFNPGVYHRRTSAAFETFFEQLEDGRIRTTPINIDNLNETGFEFSLRYSTTTFLSFNADFNYYLFNQSGNYNDQDMSAKGSVWRGRINSNVRLKNDYRFMISYQYRGPQDNAQVKNLASSDLSVSISKSFLNDKINASIRGSNLLDTRRWQSIYENDNYLITQNSRRTGARFSLNLTYKFNYTDRDQMRTQNRGNR